MIIAFFVGQGSSFIYYLDEALNKAINGHCLLCELETHGSIFI